jgi:S1-C subfamily serine protease
MWLEVLSGEDAGRVVEIDRPLVLGRVQGADLVIRDARASRRHAELGPVDGGVRLRDLGSANGTLVGGQPAADVVLRGGEEVGIGGVRIAVLAEEPAVTGAPLPEQVRSGVRVETEGPSWSMVGRLVDARTRRGRRLTYAALAAATLAVAGVLALALTGALAGDSDEERVARVIRELGPATLQLETRTGAGARGGIGAAWMLDRRENLIVTAAHVVNTGERYFVRSGSVESEAELFGVAPCEDLAVLHVTHPPDGDAPALDEFGQASQGETVLAFGYPETGEAAAASSTRGVVSAPAAPFDDPAADVPAYPAVIRTDTALDPGFSGGPLLDLDGRLVGINAAARTEDERGRRLQGANYAIAAERAEEVLGVLRFGDSLGWIGATFGYPTTAELARRGLPPGLWVRGVVPASAAEQAGLEPNDYIVAVNGRPLDGTLAGWCKAAGGVRSGDTVALRLAAQSGATRTVRVRPD